MIQCDTNAENMNQFIKAKEISFISSLFHTRRFCGVHFWNHKKTHTYLYNANMQRSLTNSQLFKYSIIFLFIPFSMQRVLRIFCASNRCFFFLSCRNISRIKIILNQIMIAIIVTGASIGSTQLIFYWLNAAVAIVILVVEPSTTGQ